VRYEAEGWGIGELCTEGRRVLWHELPRDESPRPHPGWGADPPPTTPTLPQDSAQVRDDFVKTLAGRLRAFFAGEPSDFLDVDVELDGCTPFHRTCAEVMRAVPRGEVVTYGELAALAGAPGAARAAGTFCAQNNHSIFVPCHRVVAAGGLGGYGSLGAGYKRRLLALEGVTL